MSRTERPLAPGHDRLQGRRLGRRGDQHLACDRGRFHRSLRSDAGRSLPTAPLRGCRARRPPSSCRRRSRPSARSTTAAVPCRSRRFARFASSPRPGNEITAAPFRDRMYQPCNRSPSTVVNSTSSKSRDRVVPDAPDGMCHDVRRDGTDDLSRPRTPNEHPALPREPVAATRIVSRRASPRGRARPGRPRVPTSSLGRRRVHRSA